ARARRGVTVRMAAWRPAAWTTSSSDISGRGPTTTSTSSASSGRSSSAPARRGSTPIWRRRSRRPTSAPSGGSSRRRRRRRAAAVEMVDALFAAGQAATDERPVRATKYVGDGFFLTGGDPSAVASAAFDALDDIDRLLPLSARAGLAYGPLLRRAGDYFGLP